MNLFENDNSCQNCGECICLSCQERDKCRCDWCEDIPIIKCLNVNYEDDLT